MLIRSQDKKILINFNGAYSFEIMELDTDFRIVCFDAENDYSFASYSTKEKALKVLDMIQDAYEKYEYEKVFKTGLRLFETFQMPEDSEVKV